jgi:hypothetical protein
VGGSLLGRRRRGEGERDTCLMRGPSYGRGASDGGHPQDEALKGVPFGGSLTSGSRR